MSMYLCLFNTLPAICSSYCDPQTGHVCVSLMIIQQAGLVFFFVCFFLWRRCLTRHQTLHRFRFSAELKQDNQRNRTSRQMQHATEKRHTNCPVTATFLLSMCRCTYGLLEMKLNRPEVHVEDGVFLHRSV